MPGAHSLVIERFGRAQLHSFDLEYHGDMKRADGEGFIVSQKQGEEAWLLMELFWGCIILR